MPVTTIIIIIIIILIILIILIIMTMTTENDRSMLADPSLLEKIDKLFACNVGEYINLPQLVVVGDQSSGKSSVLEGLTKLSFPRDSGLCTRFATQIIFRRDAKSLNREISASIIPASDLQGDEEQKLRAWKASGLQALSENGFFQMMKEVSSSATLFNLSLWNRLTGIGSSNDGPLGL